MEDKQLIPSSPNDYKDKFEAELRKKLLEALRVIEEATREDQ